MKLSTSLMAVALGTSLAIGAATTVHADVIPPEQAACQGKNAGDACMKSSTSTTNDGTCVSTTCSKITYGPDGGRGSTTYACVECTGPAPSTTPTTTPTTTPSTTPSGSKPSGGGGCSMGQSSRFIGPLMLALAVPLLLRRRRSAR